MKLKKLTVILATVGVLMGCSGGGGGGETANTGGTTSSTAKVTLAGVVSKGLVANADVGVFGVNTDGTLATAALATTTTDGKGAYSLSFSATKDQPVVVKMTAKADGTTTHLDEVSASAQALPAGFSMRALLVPASAGDITASASVTPFSELVVSAAAKATGGITATNAAQATSTVSQLLGFDPTIVKATSVAGASTPDEQKLAVLLAAVSKLANSGDLGCSTGSPGAKTKCVVDTLASAASSTSVKLATSGGVDVSAALGGALTSVLSDSSLTGSVSAANLAVVSANLACTTSCNATGGNTNTAATAIAGAKLLFTQMKSDWLSLFSAGGVSSSATGAANLQALAFKNAFDAANPPVETLAKDLGALLLGVDLYNDYKAGRTTNPSRGRGDGTQVSGDGSVPSNATIPTGCTLYEDSASTIVATAVSNANFIGCAARYYVIRSVSGATVTTTEWRHGFTLTPAVDGSFDYGTRARRRVQACTGATCTITVNESLQTDASGVGIFFTGKLTPTLSTAFGDITAFSLVGELPAAFLDSGNTLSGYKHVANFSGTQGLAADGTVTSTLAGSLKAQDLSGTTTSTVTLKPGSTLTAVLVSHDAFGNPVEPGTSGSTVSGEHIASGGLLNVVLTQPTAEFEGLLQFADPVWDKSKHSFTPTKAVFSGALRTLNSGVATEFVSGKFTATTAGWSTFDDTLPQSSSNSYSITGTFVGSITAPNRPLLELTMAATVPQNGLNTAQSMTLQYRSLVAGNPKLVVNVTASRSSAAAAEFDTFTLTESSAKLSASWGLNPGVVNLVYNGGLTIGQIDANSGLVTFSDLSTISLDIGL